MVHLGVWSKLLVARSAFANGASASKHKITFQEDAKKSLMRPDGKITGGERRRRSLRCPAIASRRLAQR
jgi:hypothetical protein